MRPKSLEEQTRGGNGQESEGAGETAVSPAPPGSKGVSRLRSVPDPEVVAKTKCRQFTAEYKLQVLREAEACKGPGEIGALLRREGLYSSHLNKWRKLREQGQLEALSQPRGRKPDPNTTLNQQIKRLEREKAQLQRKLRQAEAIIEVQKKVSEILGISLATPEDDETS